jgi:protein involved in plasmid replication-relaxation
MRQLETRHILLFRILRDHCLFLTRRQIQRVLTLPTNTTNKELRWLVSDKYLGRRYRADTFGHFQTPVYYLGSLGWQMVGYPMDDYKEYRLRVHRRAEHQMDHRLAIYDVFLKFILHSKVKRIIDSEDGFWQEAINFGNVPDAWIESEAGGFFIEVDRDTERPIVLGKKFEKYTTFKESGGYHNLFPEWPLKVLVFTTSEERIGSLLQITTSDDVWFCNMQEFLKEQLDHAHWFALCGFYALSAPGKKEV